MIDRERLAHRLAETRERISSAASDADRSTSEITTIVVTKFHPAELVTELVSLGAGDVGENREQEATAKVAEVGEAALTWHFIGQLQSKKARRVQRFSSWIHSVDRDSVRLALAHDSGPDTHVFVQVNLSGEQHRGGVDPASVLSFADSVAETPGLDLAGVMAVAPLDEEPRRAFARLRGLSDEVRRVHPTANRISAGMSHDFVEAIAEGATHLRIGSAITGNRPEHR